MEKTYIMGGTTDIEVFIKAVENRIRKQYEEVKERKLGLSMGFGIQITPMKVGNPVMNMYEE